MMMQLLFTWMGLNMFRILFCHHRCTLGLFRTLSWVYWVRHYCRRLLDLICPNNIKDWTNNKKPAYRRTSNCHQFQMLNITWQWLDIFPFLSFTRSYMNLMAGCSSLQDTCFSKRLKEGHQRPYIVQQKHQAAHPKIHSSWMYQCIRIHPSILSMWNTTKLKSR